MFCTRCGTQLGDTARFCTSCGKPTGAPPQAAPETFSTTDQGSRPDAEQATAQSAAPLRKLHRILTGKKMAGVCAGYAEYFDMDVTLMRLIWVGLTIIPPHLGLIAYIVSWAVLPAG